MLKLRANHIAQAQRFAREPAEELDPPELGAARLDRAIRELQRDDRLAREAAARYPMSGQQ